MKQLVYGILCVVLLAPPLALADDSDVCTYHYKGLKKRQQEIASYGAGLSAKEKNRLYTEATAHKQLCLVKCKGEKLEYCQAMAKLLSN